MDYKDEILAKIPTFLNMLEGSSLAGYIKEVDKAER